MNFPRIFRRRRSRSLDEQNPLRKLVKILLQRALEENASAIVFGIPHDVLWDFDAQLKEEQEGMAAAEAWLNDGDDYEPLPWPAPRDGFLSYPNGATSLPIWFTVNGERRPQMPISLVLYGSMLAVIAELLTSIDGDSCSFIEIPSTSTGVNRRFVNVRQTMECDNTVTLHVLGVREVGPEVPVGPVHSRSR